ncbi:MAG: c-type cytochrome [Candidatus Methylomirabilales bacterium]
MIIRAAAVAVFVSVPLLLLWSLGPALAQPLSSPTQNPIAGSRVFGTKGCSRCHAVNGIGGRVGPDLGRIPRSRSFYDLAAAMWNHFPGMAARMRELGIPHPHINPQETGDLIAFLYTLDYFDPPGNIEAGQRLFTEKRCIVCHQVGGNGGVVGPNLDFLKQNGSPIFVATAMWNHGPAMAEAMRARGITRPSFTASELRNLIAYLKSTSPAPAEDPLYLLPGRTAEGRKLFVEKGCIQCHRVGGRGGRVGPALAERGLHRSLIEFAAAMWNKAPAMLETMHARGVSVPQLRAKEMADLVAYLYAVRYFAAPGNPSKGRTLVANKGCLRCHAVRGKGGNFAVDFARVKSFVSPAAVISALWNHALVMERVTEVQRITWPRFRPQEMGDLVAYLQTLRQKR